MKSRVVIVDDHKTVRKHLANLVSTIGAMTVVGEAANGLEGWMVVQEHRPDIVLIDISMPGMNGLELARRIRDGSPLTAIVFVTVHEEESYRAIAEILQADAVVSKTNISRELPRVLRAIGRRFSKAVGRGLLDGGISQNTFSQPVPAVRKGYEE